MADARPVSWAGPFPAGLNARLKETYRGSTPLGRVSFLLPEPFPPEPSPAPLGRQGWERGGRRSLTTVAERAGSGDRDGRGERDERVGSRLGSPSHRF